MKKTHLILSLFFFFTVYSFSENATNKNNYDEQTPLIKLNLPVKIFLNTSGGYKVTNNDPSWNGKFVLNNMRLQILGDITDKLSFVYRQSFHNTFTDRAFDGANSQINFLYLAYKLTDKFSIELGKNAVAYGGEEFLANPIFIPIWSEFVSNSQGYVNGAVFNYYYSPEQRFFIQIANPLQNKYNDVYKYTTTDKDNIEQSYNYSEEIKFPFQLNLAWFGKIPDINLTTSYSIGYSTQGKDKIDKNKKYNMFYFSMGNLVEFSEKTNAYLDVLYSRENIDQKGILSSNGFHYGNGVGNFQYLTFIYRHNYHIFDNINVYFDGAYELGGVYKNPKINGKDIETGWYRRSMLASVGFEFNPIDDKNMILYAVAGLRHINYFDRAKLINPNISTSNNAEISVGFIYKIPVL